MLRHPLKLFLYTDVKTCYSLRFNLVRCNHEIFERRKQNKKIQRRQKIASQSSLKAKTFYALSPLVLLFE